MAVTCPEQCQLVNDVAFGFVEPTPCGGTEITLFQSSLTTPPDGTFSAVLGPSSCTVTFRFYHSATNFEERPFTPGPGELAIALTVPDVRKITVTCSSGTTASDCQIQSWQFTFHYCRCCG